MDIPKVLYVQAGTLVPVALLTAITHPDARFYLVWAVASVTIGLVLDVLGNVGWRWRSPLYRPRMKLPDGLTDGVRAGLSVPSVFSEITVPRFTRAAGTADETNQHEDIR